MRYFYLAEGKLAEGKLAEGKLAEACTRFTTRDLTAGSLLRVVSNSYRFHAAVQIIFTRVTIT